MPSELTLVILSIVYLVVSIFLLTQKRNYTVYLFVLICLGVSLMILDNVLFPYSYSYEIAYFLGIFGYVAGAFTSYIFLLFSQEYPVRHQVIHTKILRFQSGLHIVTQIALLIPYLIISDIYYQDGIAKGLVTSNWALLFIFCILSNVSLAFYSILHKYLSSSGRERVRLFLMIVGFVVLIFVFLITNFIFPVIFNEYDYLWVGPMSTIVFISLTAYSILRLQLFDVRILLGRITYYGLLGMVIMISYYAIYFMDIALFGDSLQLGAILIGPINAFILAIFFAWLNDYLRKQVRSRIINPGYDPLEEIDQLSRKIATQLSIRDISQSTIDTIQRTLRPRYQAVLVIPGESMKNVTKEKYLHEEGDPLVIKEENIGLVAKIWQKAGKHAIIFDELELEIPRHFEGLESEIAEIMKCMTEKDIKVIVPLKQSEDNLAMLIVGKKEADSPYSRQDVGFLDGIATTVGLAVTRSLYYLEVEDLNKNLQKRVDEATAELSEKNKDLTDALEKLEEVRRQERDMIDVMGHELRTPITIVRNALLVLQSKLEEKKKPSVKVMKEYVEKAVEGAKRELDLVETLLSATKVESNRIQMTLTKIDAIDIVEDAIYAHQHFADEKKLKIVFKKPKKDIFVYADKTRIQEVADNLLSNAIKYTMQGDVKIEIHEKDKKVHIAFIDKGIGISKEDQKNLGKKFFRAKQHLNRKDGNGDGVVRPGGTGLGLYVSFNLMKLMGGKVNVESEVGKGSTFTIIAVKHTGQEDKHVDQTFDE